MSLFYQTMGDLDAQWHAKQSAQEEKERQKAEVEKQAATSADYREWESKLMENIGRFVALALAPLEKRLKELEATATKYRGVWKRDRVYMPNDECTHAGTTWIAVAASEGSTPGKGPNWKMTRKTGQ
jgi:hypothetical protein